MGNNLGCARKGSSMYTFQHFKSRYGEATILKITKQVIKKQLMTTKMPQICQKQKQIIHQQKINSIRDLNIAQTNLIRQIQDRIRKIQVSDTGQVHKAEQKYDKPAEDIMGRQQILKDFSNLRMKITRNFDAEQSQNKQKIQQGFKNFIENMQKDRAKKIPQINEMTELQRQQVKKQARRVYRKQIKDYVKEVQAQLQQGKDYAHLHPEKQLQILKIKAHQLINKGQKTILGRLSFSKLLRSSQSVYQQDGQKGFWKCC